jgi:hypothetical protein
MQWSPPHCCNWDVPRVTPITRVCPVCTGRSGSGRAMRWEGGCGTPRPIWVNISNYRNGVSKVSARGREGRARSRHEHWDM